MIIFSDTVVYPLAMMIEFLIAFIADIAVSRISSVYGLAVRAQTLRFTSFNKFFEFQSLFFLHLSWIYKCSKQEENVGKNEMKSNLA